MNLFKWSLDFMCVLLFDWLGVVGLLVAWFVEFVVACLLGWSTACVFCWLEGRVRLVGRVLVG